MSTELKNKDGNLIVKNLPDATESELRSLPQPLNDSLTQDELNAIAGELAIRKTLRRLESGVEIDPVSFAQFADDPRFKPWLDDWEKNKKTALQKLKRAEAAINKRKDILES